MLVNQNIFSEIKQNHKNSLKYINAFYATCFNNNLSYKALNLKCKVSIIIVKHKC